MSELKKEQLALGEEDLEQVAGAGDKCGGNILDENNDKSEELRAANGVILVV